MRRSADAEILTLGPFAISATDRTVVADGQQVGLTERDVEVLLKLAQKLGSVVGRRELADPTAAEPTAADASALDERIVALNLALAPYGQGRYYVIEVDQGFMLITPERDDAAPTPMPLGHNLPHRPTPIIGRDRALRDICAQLQSCRLLSIVGGGGVGKTTLALAAAETETYRFRDGARLLELAATTEPLRVAPALAALLDVRLPEGDPLRGLVEALAPYEMLLILDNCEQVVEEAARVAQAILEGTTGIRILATSRESLEVPGERVYRLVPLEVPPDSASATWPEAMRYSAVQLFVEHARRADPGFWPEAVAPLQMIELCRRLDGLPLAIELMAAWVDFYGVAGLLSELDTRLMKLTNLAQPAQASHRSLELLVDWSHAQLSEAEQTTFRRISVFHRSFGFESAFSVTVDSRFDQAAVLNHLVRLAAKSLLNAEVVGGKPMYRLPECNRAYAAERLSRDAQCHEIRRRHAVHMVRVFDSAAADREALSRTAFLAAYGPMALDVSAALEWAFSPDGDSMLGIELTASSLHLGLDLSLVNEYRALVESVLTEPRTRNFISPAVELQFSVALGGTIAVTEGPGPSMDAAVRKLSALSERKANSDLHWKSLYGMWIGAFARGNYRTANDLAQQLQRDASTEWTRRESRRMLAQSRHHLGDHTEARRLAEGVLSETDLSISPVLGGVDHGVSMRIVLARIEWLEGRPEIARRLAEESVSLAANGVSQAMCQALSMAAFPIAWWSGETAEALRLANLLRSFAGHHALGYYVEWATLFDAVMSSASGASTPASSRSMSTHLLDFKQRDMWWSLVGVDQPADMEAALERAASGETGWNVPDLLRACAAASTEASPGEPGVESTAIARLEQALVMARAQGANAWELRCATSLAPLLIRQGRWNEVQPLLQPLMVRFADSPSLPDVRRCRAVLDRVASDAGSSA